MARYQQYGIPPEYFTQIQAQMEVGGFPWCDVVVYVVPLEHGEPHLVQVTRFFRDERYWADTLLPALTAFYFQRFLPLLQARLEGKLEHGAVVLRGEPPVPAAAAAASAAGSDSPTTAASTPLPPCAVEDEDDTDAALPLLPDMWSLPLLPQFIAEMKDEKE